MELQVIGSGSKGNCYALTDLKGSQLILEAGVSFKETKKALNYDISNIIGCTVSHEHMTDHAKSVEDFVKAGINVYCSQGTSDNIKYKQGYKPTVIEAFEHLKLGDFTILPFKVTHDAAEPLGFLISHPECGNILFATDTKDLNYKFPNINHWIIEANYSEDLMREEIEQERLHGFLANRIYENHMSLETCISVLKENDRSNIRTITLIHLSSTNAWGEQFQKKVSRAIGVKPNIATKGLTINLFK